MAPALSSIEIQTPITIEHPRPSRRLRFFEAAGAVMMLIIVPVLIALLPGVRPEQVIALVGSTLVIESGAPVAGVALGLPPWMVLVLVTSIVLGVVLLIFFLLDTLDAGSPRVAGFLQRVRQRYLRSKTLQCYGIYGLVPGMVIVGMLFCPPIAWLVGWDRLRSVLLMMLGFLIAAAATLVVASDILSFLPTVLRWFP